MSGEGGWVGEGMNGWGSGGNGCIGGREWMGGGGVGWVGEGVDGWGRRVDGWGSLGEWVGKWGGWVGMGGAKIKFIHNKLIPTSLL